MSNRTTKSAKQRLRVGARQRWACCHLAAGSSPLCSFIFWSSCGNFFHRVPQLLDSFRHFFPRNAQFFAIFLALGAATYEKRELRRSCDVIVATQPFFAAPQLEEQKKSKNFLIES